METTHSKTPSHLIYLPSQGWWVEATYVPDVGGEPGWCFKNGDDAAAFLNEPLSTSREKESCEP